MVFTRMGRLFDSIISLYNELYSWTKVDLYRFSKRTSHKDLTVYILKGGQT